MNLNRILLIAIIFTFCLFATFVVAGNNNSPNSNNDMTPSTSNSKVSETDDQFFKSVLCNLRISHEIQVATNNIDSKFSLLLGVGTVDRLFGIISYRPDTSGTFEFLVEVSDSMNVDTVRIIDEVTLNSPPVVFCQDSTLRLCKPEEICVPISIFDTDGDETQLVKLEGIGDYSQIDDSTGQFCFTPADVDSATYMFIFRATDSCQIIFGAGKNTISKATDGDPCCKDTSFVTVIIEQAPSISCPEDIYITDCELRELCFDVGVINPNNEQLELNIISGNATISDNQVCTDIEEDAKEKTILIELVGELCGIADTCSVTINRSCNRDLYLDLKPTSCPNPLNLFGNTGRNATIPAALLGTDELDVREIDVNTILLEGVSPARYNYEDVAAPLYEKSDSCECTTDGPDGFEDLTLKFNKNEIVDALGERVFSDKVLVTITGKFIDGSSFEATDCFIIRNNRNGKVNIAENENTGLIGNSPNPFNPSTVISFALAQGSVVKLEVFNVRGQIITTMANKFFDAGTHRLTWDSNTPPVSSGVYFYRLTIGDLVQTKKMLLLK